ncbi:phosphatidate cytidylyltransferase, mitochondrial isoform X2 [Capsicum annuum]|uniref:phosphatidate cytidylyltransferase, mitochondrial isoform X2 n=1 Tax=Capsicum annuum TaxID=4072 RepID=UPI001FB0F77C|nr:phosphatidate cytidylyltransferase, mitochondrial isoform X2 [Capsicum annuum]XP_047263076.1 phosphatidate cytidylyltransferase, mitochondrial isoform X2 [Capsicum annuum]
MVGEDKAELRGLLEILPPVEFCCIYGSKLHPNNKDETSMTDHIIGVADPRQWHSENLNLNKDHYASWLVHLGGARMINDIANDIGVGVHFNPFVSCNKKMVKYGVVRMHDFIQDILRWDRFYLSGRLQKPVNILVDKLDIKNVNTVNLKAATSAALLLLPSKFTEEDLYAKICSLSYMGDLRMLFAEDKNKDCGLSAASTLVSSLPSSIRSDMAMKLGDKRIVDDSGRVRQVVIGSKEQAAECMKRLVRRRVMFSSTRQAAAGLLTAGAVHGVRYVANKMCKAWKSRV